MFKSKEEKKTMKKLMSKIIKNKTTRIISLVLVAIIAVGIVLLCTYNRKEKIDTDYIIAQLEKSSELTTAKLKYTGLSKFEDAGIEFINKSNFRMLYKATARAGIDVKDVKIEADDITHTLWLTIPKAKIIDIDVDMNSIEYFDEKFALFNVNSKEDANKAVVLAEEEARKELANMGILEMADEQSEALIKGLIQELVPHKYEIKVKKK